MATRRFLTGLGAGLFVAVGIAMFAGPADAQEVKIDVVAKGASTKASISALCPQDCAGTQSASGEVQCKLSNGTTAKVAIACAKSADPNPGNISFYSGANCAPATKRAQWGVGPHGTTEVFCMVPGPRGGTAAFGPKDQISGKIENEP